MSRKARLFAAAALSTLTVSLVASAALVSIDSPKFTISGAAKPKVGPRLEFSGTGPFSAREVRGNLVFSAKMSNVDLGERTSHMREDCHADGHPDITLTVDKDKLKIPDDNQRVVGDVPGSLKFHGQTKNVRLKYVAKRTGSDYHIKDAEFTFDYTSFGIPKICRFKGTICVEPRVTIKVPQMKLRDK